MKNIKGFTLIELLVVILIIGILAAIAIPQYKKAVFKTRMAEAFTIARSVNAAQKRYFTAHHDYSNSADALDINIPNCTWSEYNAYIGRMDCKNVRFFIYPGWTSMYLNNVSDFWINIHDTPALDICSDRISEKRCKVLGYKNCYKDGEGINRCTQ